MPKARASGATDEQIIAGYKTGSIRSISRTAVALGVGEATVHRALKKHGIDRDGLIEYRKTMSAPKTEPYIGVYTGSEDEIISLYQSGLSMREVADRIGRSTTVVLARLKRAGINRTHGVGAKSNMWTGGRVLDTQNGYWKQWVSDDDPMASMRAREGYVKEHRLNLARKLGRPLLETETVHHINGDRADNRPENLELRQGKHGKHVVMCCMDCGSRNIGHAPLNVDNKLNGEIKDRCRHSDSGNFE